MAAGALAVVAGLVLLRGAGGSDSPATVAVPPLEQISLTTAVRRGRCTLALRRPQAAPTAPSAAHPGIFETPLPAAVREAALRRGFVVIEYRRDLAADVVDQLTTIQETVPGATLLAPASGSVRGAFVIASAARELRCGRVTPPALDAMRLFRGRFLGTRQPAR